MANSSFYKNVGTSTQIQGSASASAAAALASEQAALASKNAAAVSETNSAASAASALVHSNAAASSVSSINANAISTAADVVTSAGHAATTTTNATTSTNAAAAAAADVVLTNADVVSTNADAVATAADRVQTGLDVTASSASAAAALVSKNASATSETNAAASAASSSSDATATAADRVQTGLDRTATNNDATQTAADRVQTGLDVTASASSASSASTSAAAASASQVAAASSAASAAAVFSDFEDRYYGPHASDSAAQTYITGQGLTVDQGDLYFNSTANEMRVYDGGSFIAASSAGGASLINYHYTATASQTTFSGSDENSNTLSYTVENLIVTRNGIVLEDGTDYTATSGTSVVLAVAAAVNDEINIVAFKSFTTADMVSKTNGGAFVGNVDFGAGIDVTGNVTLGDNGKAIFGVGSDLEISHNGTENVIDSNLGTLVLRSANAGTIEMRDQGSQVLAQFNDNSDVKLYHNNNLKLSTTAVGIGADQVFGLSDTDTGIALGANGADIMQFYTANNERMRIAADGKVGVGTASPSAKAHIQTASSGSSVAGSGDELFVEGSGDAGITVGAGNTSKASLFFADDGDSAAGRIRYDHSDNSMQFGTNGQAEHLRLNVSGQLGIGTATNTSHSLFIHDSDFQQLAISGDRPTFFLKETNGAGNVNFQIRLDGGELQFQQQNDAQSSASTKAYIRQNGAFVVGSSTISGSAGLTINNATTGRASDVYRGTVSTTNHISNWYSDVGGTLTIQQVHEASGDIESRSGSFGGTSDRTLKENIIDATNQWDDIKALEFKKFNFIGQPDKQMLGVIAQDVEAAGMSGLVKTSEETGKMSVRYSVLYMKAVIALQEAMQRIETLEARVAALETN